MQSAGHLSTSNAWSRFWLLYANLAHCGGSWWAAPASLPQERIFLTLSNYIFTAVFLAEMTVKVRQAVGTSSGPLLPGGCGAGGTVEGLEGLAGRPQWREGWGLQGGGW